jgi:hypothetical protein
MFWNLFISHIYDVFGPTISAISRQYYSNIKGKIDEEALNNFPFMFLYLLMSWAWLADINLGDIILLYLFN